MQSSLIKTIVYVLFLLIAFSNANGQKTMNLPEVDKETYSLWQKNDWKNLIKVGKKALNEDVDFYYLRVRMGIAYYQKKNYHAAIIHFEKAYSLNAQESYLKEYLYYSYLFAGRTMEANTLYSSFESSLKKKIGTKTEKFIDGIDLSYGVRNISDETVIEDFSTAYTPPNDGLQEITRSLNIFNVGLQHDFSPKFSIYHSFSNIKKLSFEHRVENGIIKTTANLKTSINQYYLSGGSRIGKGLNLLYGVHFISIRYPIEVNYFRQGSVYRVTETAKETDLVGFISMHKSLKYITLNTSVSFAELNSATQTQANLGLTLYPLGNLNLYSSSNVSFQKEFYSDGANNAEIVYFQSIGFKTLRFIWLEGFLSMGNISNFVADDGATVFNGTETIKQRFGAKAIVIIKPNLRFQLNYIQNKANSYFIESINTGTKYNPVEYSNKLITGGIIWNF